MTDRLTIAQVAEALGRHPNTIRGWIKSGKLPATLERAESGPTYLIDRAEVEARTESPRRQTAGAGLIRVEDLSAVMSTFHDLANRLAEAEGRAARAEAEAAALRERLAERRGRPPEERRSWWRWRR